MLRDMFRTGEPDCSTCSPRGFGLILIKFQVMNFNILGTVVVDATRSDCVPGLSI